MKAVLDRCMGQRPGPLDVASSGLRPVATEPTASRLIVADTVMY
jgi:hypothetical protein